MRLATDRAKAGKIVLAEQHLRAGVHRRVVQGSEFPAQPVVKQRARHVAVVHQVTVTARERAVTGMEFGRHRAHPAQPYVARQAAIGTQHPGTPVALGIRFEMRDLLERVHAGVGAPGTDQRYRVIGNEAERLLDVLLHRRAMRLPLPAAIGRPGVLNSGSVNHGPILQRVGDGGSRQAAKSTAALPRAGGNQRPGAGRGDAPRRPRIKSARAALWPRPFVRRCPRPALPRGCRARPGCRPCR